MDLASALGLVAVLALVLANGFFVATEFSTVAVRRSRLEQLEVEGHPSAKDAKDVVGHMDAYIAATQLGITMASLALGWIGKPALANLIDPPLVLLFGYADSTAAHAASAAVAFAIITALHIVIGELAPKGLALQRPEGTALWVARPIKLFYLIFRWPINFLNGIGNGTLRVLGLPPTSGHEMVHSVEELRLLVTGMHEAGVVEASEARIASHAFRFGELTAGSLMTPRIDIEAVSVTTGLDKLLARAATGTHNRLMVYEDSLDSVVGVLHVRDLFKVLDQPRDTFDLRMVSRAVLMVPESKPADDLLEQMRASRQQLAVVIDEYGGTAGIVTLEDLVEALIGQIEEETPMGPEGSAPATDQPEPDGSLLLDGLTRLDELEEVIGLRLDGAIREEAETVGGLVMALLGRIPRVGDQVTVGGRTIRVEQLDGRRVETARLLPVKPPPVGEIPAA